MQYPIAYTTTASETADTSNEANHVSPVSSRPTGSERLPLTSHFMPIAVSLPVRTSTPARERAVAAAVAQPAPDPG